MAGLGEGVPGGSPPAAGAKAFQGEGGGSAGPSEVAREPTCTLSFGGRCLSLWAVSMFILQVARE